MKRLIYLLILLFSPFWCFSQSIFQAGRINVDYVAGSAVFALKVSVELVAVPTANPPSAVNVCWGDGNCEDISLIQSNLVGNHLFLSYEGFYSYLAEGTYVISTSPCCFTNSSSNIEDSGSKLFPLEVVYIASHSSEVGHNNPTDFLQPLLDFGTTGQQLIYNPNSYDEEADSIAYELVAPDIEGYLFPDEVVPFSSMEMDSVTGNILWNNPDEGIYHIAYKAKDYRNGQLLSTQTVIMQIEINPSIVSTDEVSLVNVKAFPNPTEDFLILKAGKSLPSNWQVQIFNSLGQLIKAQTWSEGSERIEIPVHQFPEGPYWLKISDGVRAWSEKVIIRP